MRDQHNVSWSWCNSYRFTLKCGIYIYNLNYIYNHNYFYNNHYTFNANFYQH